MTEKAGGGWVKPALEFGPVLAFFAGFLWLRDTVWTVRGVEYEGFVIVTAFFVPLMLVATGLLWKLTGKLSKMQLVTIVLIVIFGGLTVWLNDPSFIKMKPTMIYLIFAGLLGFGLLRGQSYLQMVMEELMPLEREGWMLLTKRIALFFLGLAVLNELVWRTLSDTTWVSFKTFGLPIAMFAFFMAQAGLFKKYGPAEEEG